jgi:hypothetical protein
MIAKFLNNLKWPLIVAIIMIGYFTGMKWMIEHTDPNTTMAAFMLSLAVFIAVLRTVFNDGRSN